MSDFSYLYVHTHFSRGGGPASPAEWCRRAAQLGYKALAIANRSPLAGLPSFLDTAKREGLTPICGAELDVLLSSGGESKIEPVALPVVLFARNSRGMQNLSSLCTLAYSGWATAEIPVGWEALVKHSEGLAIVLVGEDEVGSPAPILELRVKRLTELGVELKEHFGNAAFVGLPGESALAKRVASLAEQMGLPVVAMPAARYLNAKDAHSYTALRSARAQVGWGQKGVGSGQEYLRSPGEAEALFKAWPQAVENVARVVEMCSGVRSTEYGALNKEQETDTEGVTLRRIAERQLLALLSVEALPDEMRDRLDDEVRAITGCGRSQAWLALGSLVEAARANRVPLGAPLGMADGALLAYALGISSLNPLPYARPSWLLGTTGSSCPPLPGVEVPSARRDMLIAALAKEYGWERIAHAACTVDITPVAAAQAALATLNVAGDESRLLLAQAIEKGWAAFTETGTTSGGDGQQSPGTLAASLQGAPLCFKPDPDTLFIAPGSQRDSAYSENSLHAPLISSNHSSEGKWVPWTEEALCSLGYPAFSLRPSRALTILDNALTLTAKYPAPTFVASSADPSIHPKPDEPATALITKGEVAGIPYITPKAAKGWKDGLTQDGMAALVAHSIARHKIQNPKITLEPAEGSKIRNLEGKLLYHDQADTLISLAGLSGADATTLRLSLRRPDLDGDGALRARLGEGCVQSGLSEEDSKALQDAFVASGHGLISRYAAHAWGRVALWSAVVKAAHPAAFLAGALAVAWDGRVRSNVSTLTTEARRLSLRVLPPDANRSHPGPVLERDGPAWAIVWGLALLPGWSARQAERFVAARPSGGVVTLRDLAILAAEAELTLSQLESLVQSGACDHLGGQARDRQALLDALGPMLEWAQAQGHSKGQPDLFATTASQEPPVAEIATLQAEPPSPLERHGYRAWEETNLGAAFTPAQEIDALRQALKGAGDLQSRLLTTAQITAEHIGKSIFMVGLLTSVSLLPQVGPGDKKEARSQGEIPLAVAQIEDLEGSIELVAFPPNYKRHKELWVEHNLVIITARVSSHAEGTLYLLCEHLVPFQATDAEEELSFKVKIGRSGACSTDSSTETTVSAPAKDVLAQTQVVAVPRSAPNHPVTSPSATYPPHAHNNGNGNSNVYSNGHGQGVAVGAHTETKTEQAAGTPAYKLIISLPISEDDRTDIDTMLSLNDILAAHPGSDTVMLRIPYSQQPEAVTFAHLPRGARYSSHLEAKLSKLLGPEAVAVIKLQV